ncbi:MAG TPA: PQQ-binding-like beta-propeller repeat protein [Planctomycetota bacterium]|nr:PQQ-binding-like beta-propeller repeat protein [Planctomycetota bacterium]
MNTLRSVLILALLAAAARGDDWTHLGRDDGRSRLPPEVIANPALLAAVATGSETIASPIASDGFLILAGLDGTVRSYRESDLLLQWTVATGSPIVATPLADHGRVYVSGLDGIVRVLGLADGAALGSVSTGSSGHSSPLLSGGRLFLGTAFPNPAVSAIDPGTKTVAWTAALDQVTYSSPAVGGGKVLIPTNNGTLAAFDATSGAPVWSAAVGGAPGGSSPLILGSSVFVLIEGTLLRLDLDTGIANATVSLNDVPPANALSAEWTCSSLGVAGGMLTGTARVDYGLDQNADGVVDGWTMREFAFSADPAAMTLAWQTPLASLSDVGLNAIPPYRIIPSPVTLGSTLACASSLDSSLRILTAAGGPTATISLDAPSQSSLLLANARLYALTRAGTLYVLEDPAAPQPPVITGLAPAGAHLAAAPATLDWTAGAAGSTYTVRLAQDGEILMDWDVEQVTGTPSIPCPALSPEHRYTWAVRVRNPAGAYAPWSSASFAVGSAPPPASGLTALPRHGRVVLSWTASPSADVSDYQVAFGVTGSPLGLPADVGNVATTAVDGLVIGTSYTFAVTAVNSLGFVSTPITVTATPVSTVTIGGTSYLSIAAALAAAQSGDVVRLSSDVYTIAGTLQIPPGVTLQGVNALETQIVAASAITMVDAATGGTVRDLALSGGAIGVSATGPAVVITHCVIRNMSDAGIDASGLANVISNTIVGNTNAGIRATGRAEARNNIVQDNGTGLVGAVISKYNDVSDGYQGCSPGEGDRNAPVAFLAPAAGDYREQSGQPSLDAGAPGDDYSNEPMPNGFRINLGAFGNTSLAATTPEGPSSGGGGGGSCGLLGLDGVALLGLLLLRRR